MSETNNEKYIARFTVIMPQVYKDKVEKLSKTYRITQGEILEVLLDQVDLNTMEKHFIAKRESKVVKRSKASETKKALMQKIKDLSPEALEKLLSTVVK